MRLFILILFSTLCFTAHGEVIAVGKKMPYTSIGRSISYLEDKTSTLSLPQVINADRNGAFTAGDREVLNFGNTASAYWLKLSYTRPTSAGAYLVIDIGNIEDIQYYYSLEPGKYHRIRTGSLAPAPSEVTVTNRFIFNLPDGPYVAGNETVYVRVKSDNILLVPIKIVTADQLLTGMDSTDRFEAITIGILMALFLFNVSVYIKSKDLAYFFYSIRILALFCYLIFYFRGYGYLLGDTFRYFINGRPHIFMGISILAALAFSYKFLNIRDTLPPAIRVLQFLGLAWLVLILTSAFGLKSLSSDMVQALAPVTIFVLWGTGLITYISGYRPALYYTIAWSFISLTTIGLVFCLAGILPYNESSFHFVPLGFIFELLLLSLALGDRVREIKRSRLQVQADKLKVQQENLYLISSQNERLEKIVESRTRTLKKMVQSLEVANADKTRIFSIIAHDLRSPFNSLISLFSLNDMNMLTFDDVKMLLNDSRKNIDNIHNTLNNLLYWAQSQMKGIKTAPSRFNMGILVEDLLAVYHPLINKKKISINFAVADDTDVFADLDQINLVMRNLIDNAIKFTPHGLTIGIRIWGSDNHIFVDVCNPVVDPLSLEKMLTKADTIPSYGTSNERGVGLGLHLCRDFVEKNHGVLKVSKEDECVVLRFNIPKYFSDSEAINGTTLDRQPREVTA